MAETNAPPTDAEILAIRFDVDSYLIDPQTKTAYATNALTQFKNDIEDKRNVKFTQVFNDTADAYFTDTDSYTRNLNKIRKYMLANLAVALIFRDYAINMQEDGDGVWFNVHLFYLTQYEDALKTAQLDIDLDEDGAIDEDEERASAQKYFSK